MKKIGKTAGILFLLIVSVILVMTAAGTIAQAAGLIDDAVKAGSLYSEYPLLNYSLDCYADDSWSWLPWNMLSGKTVLYAMYIVTNFIWVVSLYISYGTGYVVEQAYRFDFINDVADKAGKNIQTLAGINESGFQNSGYYIGFLLLLILILGVYVAYVGLVKRETSKAVQSCLNFIMIFILSAVFIANAPSYIKKINEFSTDVSSATLDLGAKLVLSDSNVEGDSVSIIRDSLFRIQVKEPWLLLQFGDTNETKTGAKRIKQLLSVSPTANWGKDREKVVKEEVEKKDNVNLSLNGAVSRLATVVFVALLNFGISVFVILLSGHMIFAQILFLIYAMMLPMSFIVSMIPSYNGNIKKTVERLFNTVMMRAVITLVLTIAFSLSVMFYEITTDYPFFLTAFFQIVIFAGIYFKLSDLSSMVGLNGNDTQQMGQRIMRRPYMIIRRNARLMERRIGRSIEKGLTSGGRRLSAGAFSAGSRTPDVKQSVKADNTLHRTSRQENMDKSTMNQDNRKTVLEKPDNKKTMSGHTAGKEVDMAGAVKESLERPNVKTAGEKLGEKAGAVLDTKKRVRDNVKQIKEKVKDAPVNMQYKMQKEGEKVRENVSGFKVGMQNERLSRESTRENKQKEYRENMNQKRETIQRKKEGVVNRDSRRTEGKEGTVLLNGEPYVTRPQKKGRDE